MTGRRSLGVHLLELLAAYGVETVFGIPGVHTVEMYRGFPGSRVRHITPRHEQGAGFMADGYARVTGKPGVCFVITGPGLTNIATAMAQAYADSIPMLVVSSLNRRGAFGSGEGHLHELPDQRWIAAGLAARSSTILRAEDLAEAVAGAFALFAAGRPRPVHIEIPTDLLSEPADHLPPPVARPLPHRAGLAMDAAERATALLRGARQPVLVAGGGAVDAAAAVTRVAETLDAPVVMTTNGRGILPAGHPLGVPCSPELGPVADLLRDADVVLAAGTEWGPTDFDAYGTGMLRLPGQLIRIDLDPAQAMHNQVAAVPVIADAGDALGRIATLLAPCPGEGAARAARARAAVRDSLTPLQAAGLRLLEVARDVLPEAPILADSTQPGYSGMLAYGAPRPRAFAASGMGYGTLGYALPAAIGAAVGRDGPAVCVIGDGGIQFTLAELGAAREIDAPVIVLLWNNRGYGEIRRYMEERQIAPLGVDIYTPDFLAIARAFGCAAARPDRPEELPALLRAAAARRGPTLIEVDEAVWS